MSKCLLITLQDCEATCEHMTTYIKCRPDVGLRLRQLGLLRDCADICTLTAKFVARCSPYAKSLAKVCADICETCGNECLKYPDPESQNCGHICLNCARKCRAFAMS